VDPSPTGDGLSKKETEIDVALPHDFGYRKKGVASRECYPGRQSETWPAVEGEIGLVGSQPGEPLGMCLLAGRSKRQLREPINVHHSVTSSGEATR
jgi:hypothetical protein